MRDCHTSLFYVKEKDSIPHIILEHSGYRPTPSLQYRSPNLSGTQEST